MERLYVVGKRPKIEITKSDALQEVDEELEGAMARLDGANERVDELLANLDADPEAAEADECAAKDGEQASGGTGAAD